MAQWYYAKGDHQLGPVSTDELRQMAAAGGLAQTDLVWCEGMADWAEAKSVAGMTFGSPQPAVSAAPAADPFAGAAPAAQPQPQYPAAPAYSGYTQPASPADYQQSGGYGSGGYAPAAAPQPGYGQPAYQQPATYGSYPQAGYGQAAYPPAGYGAQAGYGAPAGYGGQPAYGAAGGAIGYYTPQQYGPYGYGGVQYAGFWWRFLAYVIDWVIVNVIGFVIGLIVGFVGVAAGSRDTEAIQVVAQLIQFVIVWLYYTIQESSAAQATLGKRACGLRVVDLGGARITFGRANGRFFGKILSCATAFVGFIMAGFTEKKQGLHDMIAGTLVVRKQ